MFSIWERTGFMAEPHVAVVGAGITGLFTALHHKRWNPGHHVVVLERGPHPCGASVKNAGFACFGSPSEILADIDAEGPEAAIGRVEDRWQGLRELRAELGDERIGFEASGGHEVFLMGDPLYTRVASRFDELNRMLLPIVNRPAYEWRGGTGHDLGLNCGPIAYTPLEGALDSGKLMRALLDKVREAGVDVRFRHVVRAVEEGRTGVDLQVDGLGTIHAGQVVIATNGYARDLLPNADVLPARGQVLLTDPVPGLRLKGTFHLNEGYFYFRDHLGGVLLGGGRHLDKRGETTTEDAVTPRIQNALEDLLRETILPGQPFNVALRWNGVMGFRTQGKTALVDRVSPRMVVAAGLCGMGVAIGIRVAKKAADRLSE